MSTVHEYFSRNQPSLSAAQQESLREKKVAVIGCGGLGGYVIEELVRLGVGGLCLFDPDVFAPSNCNRQLNALTGTLERGKAAVAAERSAAIHPHCQVAVFACDFREVAAEVGFQVDAVVDCLDDIQARHDLAALCCRLQLPLIHGAVHGWCGQVGIQLPEGDLLQRLYPRQAGTQTSVPSVLSFTVALVASLQVAETTKVLLGLPSPLENTWLYIDLHDQDFILHSA